MRWKDERRSENVEDRRRIWPAGIAIGGGIGALIFVLVAMFRGAEPRALVDLPPDGPQKVAPRAGPSAKPAGDPLKDFVAAILGDTEDVWRDLFRKMDKRYREPHLVLFTGRVRSACGLAGSAVGPFYCPEDENVYIDLTFFRELEDHYHASGDFARAYIIAHEVGHHVQNLLGTQEKVRTRQRGLSKEESNQVLVRLELQADFLAGVWAHHADKARHILEPGDVKSALRAMTALDDDRLPRDAKDAVVTDSFTRCWDGKRGIAHQRVRWFNRGLKTGDLAQGDTFTAGEL
jgi:predicted metalloprotease